MPKQNRSGIHGRKRSPRSATAALFSDVVLTSSPTLCFLIALDPFDTTPYQNGRQKIEVFDRVRSTSAPPVIPLMVSEHDYKLYFRIATQPWQDSIASMDIPIDPALAEQPKELGALSAAPVVEDATRASDEATPPVRHHVTGIAHALTLPRSPPGARIAIRSKTHSSPLWKFCNGWNGTTPSWPPKAHVC